MRLIVVGHPFIVAYHQKKYAAMKQLDPRLELRIVGPNVYRHPFRAFSPEVHAGLNPKEVVPLSFALYRTHMTYLLNPMRMAALLRDFRPDVIHAEEEPHAFITAETLSLRGMFAPQAVVSLFTWDNLDRPRSFPVRALKHGLRAYSLRRAAVVVCGNREAEQLLRARTGYAGITAVLPQYGLDPGDHFPGHEPALRHQLGLADAVSVGYVGRLVPEKGIELLLDALAQLTQHPWKLLLVGSGPLERAIREQWMPRFPGRIVHVPAVPHGEVPFYLRCLDIFVLASYAVPGWKEQFGLALAQAMMAGLACVGSSSGAIPEVLGPGGLIFEERDSRGLAEALRSLLASPDRRVELSRKAREFALKNYTNQGLAARYLAVFEEARRAVATREQRRMSRPEDLPSILEGSLSGSGRGPELFMKARRQKRVVAMAEHPIRVLRWVAHAFLPPGSSPEIYRRLIRVLHKRLVYDPGAQTVTVQEGELAGAKKYGPFCDSDFEFALGRYEPEVTAALRQYCRPGMTAFDIGANAGHHLILLSRLCGVCGHVHAFEPVPQNVECLLETLRLNKLRNVTVHSLAVSDREGDAELQFRGVFDGFACLTHGGHGRSEYPGAKRFTITVSTSDLDTICGKFGIAQVDLIKMDIEGAELLALSGMTRILSVHRPVLVLELWGAQHIAEAPELLRRFGYETCTLSVRRGLVQGAFAETSNVIAVPRTKI